MKLLFSIFGIARRFCNWLTADLRNLAVVILAGWCITLWSNAGAWERQSNRWQTATSAEQAAHLGTVLNYRMVAIHAQFIAIANRATVEAQWRGQYQDALHVKNDLERRYHANLSDWLQHAASTTVGPSNAEGIDLPASAGMPNGAMPDASLALVHVTDLERCASGFAQLAALIGFVEAASTVETSPDHVLSGTSP